MSHLKKKLVDVLNRPLRPYHPSFFTVECKWVVHEIGAWGSLVVKALRY
jgi:hypothetical protein